MVKCSNLFYATIMEDINEPLNIEKMRKTVGICWDNKRDCEKQSLLLATILNFPVVYLKNQIYSFVHQLHNVPVLDYYMLSVLDHLSTLKSFYALCNISSISFFMVSFSAPITEAII